MRGGLVEKNNTGRLVEIIRAEIQRVRIIRREDRWSVENLEFITEVFVIGRRVCEENRVRAVNIMGEVRQLYDKENIRVRVKGVSKVNIFWWLERTLGHFRMSVL